MQVAALANTFIHDPRMGPVATVALTPAETDGRDKSEILADLSSAIARRWSLEAERGLLAALDVAEPGEILEALLPVALRRNQLDDHYLLYPIYAFRACDSLGWEWAEAILRPVVRYLARHPLTDAVGEVRLPNILEGTRLYHDFQALEDLIEAHGLTEDRVPIRTSESELPAVETLAERIAAVPDIREIGGLVAEAMGEGLSLEGAVDALSYGGGMLYLRCHSGNPFEVHIHTGVSARRYLVGLDGISFRSRAIALLNWCLGLEVRYLTPKLTLPIKAEATCMAALPERNQEDLLAALIASIEGQPPVDLEAITVAVDDLIAPDSLAETLILAQQYAEAGYDAEPLFLALAELVCRDEQTEMHAYKLQQAAWEEYHAVPPAFRWVHLMAAARHAACVVNMLPKTVWPRAAGLLTR